MLDWISVNNLSKIQGITPRAIRKAINNNRYVARTVSAKRGVKYEIFVPSLDEDTQNLIDFEKSKNEIEKADCRQRVAGLRTASRNSFIADNQANREPSLRKTQKIPTHAKQIALARFDLVNLWIDYKNHNKEDKTKAGKDFLNAYNDGILYPVLFNILGKVAIGTIYRWHKEIKANNDYENLIPKYDYGEKECTIKLTPVEETVFKSFLLSPNQINVGKATKLTKYILNKKGIETPTCERNFRRYADNFKRTHYDEWVLAREGQKALTVNKFLEEYVAKFCTFNTVRSYKSLFKMNIVPYFKDKKIENIDVDDIKNFYFYCQDKNISAKRMKNTLALLKQFLQYAKDNGFTQKICNFQVKRLSAKNEFDLNRVIFEQGATI